MSGPILPVELERKVFELAARSHPKSIPAFLLVAHRIKIWLEPILYSVVVFHDPLPENGCFEPTRFASAIQSQTISAYVKHLFIPSDLGKFPALDLELVLASCSAVEDLVLMDFPVASDLLPFVAAMPLRRLTTTLADLFFTAGIDFTHSLFTHITHLELGEHINSQWDEWKGLALIPHLTHLAFLFDRSLSLFHGALAACPVLQVLVLLDMHFISMPDTGMGLESLADDTRFVSLRIPPRAQDWQIGARGGDDFWGRAEKFIAKRVSGEIDRRNFVLLDTPPA
ncbi:hypothetical protein B0H19DRAFT_1144600 [Mycena capillaripes]|nr:hypothetical protein B0H19DRAFT_1144600 [Mycena capillaripes]